MRRLIFLLATIAITQLLFGTNYYVRPDGNNGNPGTSNTSAGAWQTIKFAATQLAGGNHTVFVADGTYNEDEIILNYLSNSKATPIVLKSINKYGAKIVSNSAYHAINLNGTSGVTIDGFDITFKSGTTSEHHGINFQGNWTTIKNCKIHGAPFTGIQGYLCDNVLIEDNIIYNNCKGTGATVHENGSGISIYHPKSRESNSGFHIIIRNNILYDNVATNYVASTGVPTDGNGIILDDFNCSQTWDIDQTGGIKYPHSSLIENNLCYNNGGRGIHIFNSEKATLRNNTCYYNNYILDANGHYSADIQIEGSGCSLYNNIAVQNPGLSTKSRAIKIYNQTPPCERNLFVGTIEGTIGSNNITYAKGSQSSVKFVNPSTDPLVANFRLQSSSPAVNAGYAPQTPPNDLDGNARPISTVDIGCYEYGGTPSNQSPTCSITSPANNANFSAPATVTIDANAADADGTVSKVEFYQGSIKLGEDLTSPYSYSWTNVAAGNYSLTVKATDDDGAVTTSPAINISVGTPPANDADIPNTSSAVTIDGIQDAAYGSVAYAINNIISGSVASSADLAGSWRALWDNINLYILVEATDDVKKNDSGTSWWDDDVVEVFIDADNSNNTTYGANDIQFTFRYNDATIRETKHNSITGVTKALTDITGGYRLEVKIPWSTLTVTPALNGLVGIDVQIDDDDDGGARDGKKAWYGNNDNAWQDPSLLATAKLVAGSGNQAPTCSITSPVNNAAFTATATVTIDANAADADGTVSKVEFYQGGTKLGEDLTSPYSYSWTNVAAGNYNLTVKATDDDGAVTTSPAINISVGTPPANDADIPNTSSAVTIDGIQDAAYGSVAYAINNIISGTVASSADLSGSWRALWDNNNLYILVEATDDVKKNDSGTSWWDDDVVEVFIDADNSNNTTYGANDFQFTFRYNDATIRETKHNSITGVTKALADITGGYRLEVKIPWSTLTVTPALNGLVGIDVQIDDDDDGGVRDGKKAWYGNNDNAWQDPSLLATAKLVAGSGNQAPTCSITSPVNNAAFTAPATVTIDANAADADGTVSKVEFYQGSTKLGEDLTSPYSYSWTNVAAGNYNLTVKATDDDGAVTTSPAINISVNTISANLLINGDFENGTANWTGGGCTITSITSPVYDGTKSLKISNRSANWAGPNQNIKTILDNNGQGDYYVEAYVRTTSGNADFHITAQLNGSTTVWKSTPNITCNSTGWTKVSGVLNLTYNGTLTAATFYVETSSGTAEYTIDGCFMKKGTTKSATDDSNDIQPNLGLQIKIYPNPTSQGFAVLLLSGKADNEKVVIKVTDAAGRALQSITSADNEIIINTQDLIHGLYFIQIENSKSLILKKLLVE